MFCGTDEVVQWTLVCPPLVYTITTHIDNEDIYCNWCCCHDNIDIDVKMNSACFVQFR